MARRQSRKREPTQEESSCDNQKGPTAREAMDDGVGCGGAGDAALKRGAAALPLGSAMPALKRRAFDVDEATRMPLHPNEVEARVIALIDAAGGLAADGRGGGARALVQVMSLATNVSMRGKSVREAWRHESDQLPNVTAAATVAYAAVFPLAPGG